MDTMSKHLVTPPTWWRERFFTSADAEVITQVAINTLRSWQRSARQPLGQMEGGRRLFTLHEIYQLALVAIMHEYGIARPQVSYAIAHAVSHAGPNDIPRPPYYLDVAYVTHDGMIDPGDEPKGAHLAIALADLWKEVVRRAELVRAANA